MTISGRHGCSGPHSEDHGLHFCRKVGSISAQMVADQLKSGRGVADEELLNHGASHASEALQLTIETGAQICALPTATWRTFSAAHLPDDRCVRAWLARTCRAWTAMENTRSANRSVPSATPSSTRNIKTRPLKRFSSRAGGPAGMSPGCHINSYRRLSQCDAGRIRCSLAYRFSPFNFP